MNLNGGETFRLSANSTVEAVHTPVHTWGHTAVYDHRSKTLISGGASIWTNIPNDDWTGALPPTCCYVDPCIATQDRLLSMDIELLASSHWPLQCGAEVAGFVQENKTYCLHVEQRLLDFIRTNDQLPVQEAINALGMELGSWPENTNQDFSYGMLGNFNQPTGRSLMATARNADKYITWSVA